MNDYPSLSLSQIEIDHELVRRLPRKLAYYHLVLPLAVDGAQTSVAMAHIDNPLVMDMLARLLGGEIVPVSSDAAEIRAALDQVWQTTTEPEPHILAWGSTPQHALTAQSVSQSLVLIFGVPIVDAAASTLDTLLMLTHQDSYVLTVAGVAASDNVSALVRQAATPVLLLYGENLLPLNRILLSLRGHAPDLSALEWVLPLAKAYRVETTVLAVTARSPSGLKHSARRHDGLAILLDPVNESAQHLAECTDRLVEAGIPGYLKLCQGDPVQQIAAEFAKGQYGLLVIVSEAQGDFVQSIIDGISATKDNYAVLVVKPALTS